MDVKDVVRSLGKLNNHLDELEENLQPLLQNLSVLLSKLPLLEKAKLFALVAYAIEALLHSSLRLQNVDVQTHPVLRELQRVQQYFGKIQAAGNPIAPRANISVNMEAATRIIKSNLDGNSRSLKEKLEEQIAKERAKALLKSLQAEKRPASSQDEARPNSPDTATARKRKRRRTAPTNTSG